MWHISNVNVLYGCESWGVLAHLRLWSTSRHLQLLESCSFPHRRLRHWSLLASVLPSFRQVWRPSPLPPPSHARHSLWIIFPGDQLLSPSFFLPKLACGLCWVLGKTRATLASLLSPLSVDKRQASYLFRLQSGPSSEISRGACHPVPPGYVLPAGGDLGYFLGTSSCFCFYTFLSVEGLVSVKKGMSLHFTIDQLLIWNQSRWWLRSQRA